MNNKSKVRAKVRKNIEQANRTGGGLFIPKKLSDNEERIIRITSMHLTTTPAGVDFGHAVETDENCSPQTSMNIIRQSQSSSHPATTVTTSTNSTLTTSTNSTVTTINSLASTSTKSTPSKRSVSTLSPDNIAGPSSSFIPKKRKCFREMQISECKKQTSILQNILDVQKEKLKISAEQLEIEKTVSQQNAEIKKMLCDVINSLKK